MPKLRLRSAAPALLSLAVLLTLSACGLTEYPNSTFNHTTDFNTSIDALFSRLVFWGTIVFVVVEAALIFTIIRYRKRPGGAPARQIHGNAALEITWTAIPAIILVLIAVPTVKTIFETQKPAPAGSLTVEVIGHQWWWEFRYPELGIVTANEVYVPVGRTVNFVLTTKDVLHSFWIPQMGGKRDLITNRTNYLWFTPSDTLKSSAWNGFCTEYCGASHANMRIRMYTVQPDEFASWARHQASPAVFNPSAPPATPVVTASNPGQAAATADTTTALPSGYVFPREQLPAHVVPQTPIPAGLAYDDALLAGGDATRGATQGFMLGGCIGCHAINGLPGAVSNIGPNLTHVASRHTIAGGLYKNDGPTLARWIKNARHLKPGSIMNTIGRGEYDPIMKMTVTAGLDDRQIADVVAYLLSLK
ncbi:MAG: cytochrome c oxidase subunit II [Gemmatimonadetes bacterium]|nr:cytochrome c oxidase subunit II [Gemmatimonadota bacterium]